MALVEIEDLTLEFGSPPRALKVVDHLSFSIDPGETVCLVGESGCGKSVTALSIARLVPSPPARYTGGQIRVEGRDVLRMSKAELRGIRGGLVSYIFQEPSASLNPVFRAGAQIKEALRLHRPEKATDAEVIQWLRRVGIAAPEARARDYPHQMSGGMQQRVMVAMALASQPKLLVADEPTTALDVTIQAQVLDLLQTLKEQLGMSLLLITHNLAMASSLADRIAVMYAGQLVEIAPAGKLLNHPFHPYTQALIESVPRLAQEKQRLNSIPGSVPRLGAWPGGCRFHPRCSKAQTDCSVQAPIMSEIEPGRWVRCPYWNRTP